MASTTENRAVFIKAALEFIVKYNYDGIDIDWEFPQKDDKANYAALISVRLLAVFKSL